MHVPLPIAEIERCSRDPEFVAAVRGLYTRLDLRIAAHNPPCTNRGACCKFATFGHNLFVSSAELAYFLALQDAPLLAPPDRSFCPYQIGGRCTAREGRPAGCRVFFCDPAAQAWQPELSQWALDELAAIGDRFGLPYAYVEWTDALRQLGGRVVQAVDPPAGLGTA